MPFAALPVVGLAVAGGLAVTGTLAGLENEDRKKKRCEKPEDSSHKIPTVNMRLVPRVARDQLAAAGIPQAKLESCHDSLGKVVVQSSIPSAGGTLRKEYCATNHQAIGSIVYHAIRW